MVIKEMSSMGAEVKAGNELDFREIFRDSRHRHHHHHHQHHEYLDHQQHLHHHNGDVDQGANGDEAPFLYSGGGEPRIWKNHSREEDRC